MDDEDSQYRTVTSHANTAAQAAPGGSLDLALFKFAGTFDPARIKSFSALSQVPLGDYQAVDAAPATAAAAGIIITAAAALLPAALLRRLPAAQLLAEE